MTEPQASPESPDQYIALIKEEIDQMVDEKMVSRANSPFANADLSAIKKECEIHFFKDLETAINKDLSIRDKFYVDLEKDDPLLSKKMIDALTMPTEINSLTEIMHNPPVNLDPSIISSLKELGLASFKQKNYEKASHYFTALTVFVPENPDFWLLNAMCKHNQEQYPDAVRCYLKTIELAPYYPYAYVQCIQSFIAADHLDDAKVMYNSLIKNFTPEEYLTPELEAYVKNIQGILNV